MASGAGSARTMRALRACSSRGTGRKLMKMQTRFARITSSLMMAMLVMQPASPAKAEDIDLFVSGAGAATPVKPNILIILDNSANWNSNSQHWPAPAGETGTFKQGQSELRAIKRVLGEL